MGTLTSPEMTRYRNTWFQIEIVFTVSEGSHVLPQCSEARSSARGEARHHAGHPDEPKKRRTSTIGMCGGYFNAHDRCRSARSFRRDCGTKCEIPKVGRDSKVTRHRMAMMTKMSEPEAAQPRPLAKLPTVHGIVNQEIRHISDNQAARGSAGNLDIPKERETKKQGRKADDAYPNRRSNEVAWTRMMHVMELPNDSYLMVHETMQQIFNKRP
jgi:hypothetical protein